MTDIALLLAEYIAEHRSGGEADPSVYVARASPEARAELAALIDTFLTRAPRSAFDEQQAMGSAAERTVEEIQRAITGQSGLWPALLPELRNRAGLKRSDLVSRLAGLLGVPNRTDKVARYYHEMEQGLLPSQGVSERVLEALGQIIGESAQALRDAGRPLGAPLAGESVAGATSRSEEWDDVDTLFRDG